MLTSFEWISVLCILSITIIGGYYPLFRQEKARTARGFPMGQAFTAGVFLALSLTMMLPGGTHLLGKAFPKFNYPIASLIAILTFLLLLAIDHITTHKREADGANNQALSSPSIPIIMTVTIAMPSFMLGAALGVSQTAAAVLILIAIAAHKGSAAFALAMKMVRSTLSRGQTFALFSLFALSTPTGIVVGERIHQVLAGQAMFLVKGTILSLASGVFLYMATLHELKNTPLIEDCHSKKGFILMVIGFILTALIRLLVGEAHYIATKF